MPTFLRKNIQSQLQLQLRLRPQNLSKYQSFFTSLPFIRRTQDNGTRWIQRRTWHGTTCVPVFTYTPMPCSLLTPYGSSKVNWQTQVLMLWLTSDVDRYLLPARPIQREFNACIQVHRPSIKNYTTLHMQRKRKRKKKKKSAPGVQ